jgi:hypothetical protein
MVCNNYTSGIQWQLMAGLTGTTNLMAWKYIPEISRYFLTLNVVGAKVYNGN